MIEIIFCLIGILGKILSYLLDETLDSIQIMKNRDYA